jgi:Cellulase (glycosyl hydrolase family 5)
MKRAVLGAFIVLSLSVSCLPADRHQPLAPSAAATAPLSTAARDSTEAQAQTPAPALMPTTTPTATPTPTPPLRPLPRLYVDGPYVKRTDTTASVWLKGVNVEEFRQRNPHTFSDLYNVQGLAIVMGQAWGINLLRVAVDPESVESTTSEFETLIDFAQEHGMYVILTPFASAVNPSRDDERLPVPDELVATAMGYLAAKFKDRTNVLFGLWNEPHPDSIPTINYDKQWQTWMAAGIKVAKAIRRSDPRSILVVPGGNKWARDMTYYQDHPFPFDNVIYDVHDYWAYPAYHYARAMWTWAIAKYPLLIGEFGGDPTNPSDYAAINYMQETLRIVNTNSGLVHYAAYALTDDGVWGIFTRDLTNTPKGNALRFDLSMHPPTRFR